MTFEDFRLIYTEMTELFKKDKELTHIEVVFHIKPVQSEKKTARINVKTFHDAKR